MDTDRLGGLDSNEESKHGGISKIRILGKRCFVELGSVAKQRDIRSHFREPKAKLFEIISHKTDIPEETLTGLPKSLLHNHPVRP